MIDDAEIRHDLARTAEVEMGVDANTAAAAVGEFFNRFLHLKKVAADRHATLVSPSAIIDSVWHRAILYSREYRQLCREECGFFVDHEPLGASPADESNRRLRYASTWVAYQRLWGTPDLQLWPEPPGLQRGVEVLPWVNDVAERRVGNVPQSRRLVLMSVPIVPDQTSCHMPGGALQLAPQRQPGRAILIFVKTITGRTISVSVHDSDTVEAIKHTMKGMKGIPDTADEQRLMYDGKQLEDGHTLKHYGIKTESTIHCIYRLRGC
jgi:hypothetical protein